MYRIRLQSGEEAVYKTVEELAAAVTSGMISPTAEVFHKAGNRWLPINTHPDYRAVITAKRQALQVQSAKDLQQASSGNASPEQSQLPVRAPTRKSQPAIQFEVIAPAASPPPPAQPVVPTVQSPKLEIQPLMPEPKPPVAESKALKLEIPKSMLEVPAPPAEPQGLRMETLAPKADPDEAPFPELAPEPEIIILDSSTPVEESLPPPDIDVMLPPGVRRPGLPVVPIALGVTGLFVAAGIAAILLTRRPGPEAPPAAPAEVVAPSPPPVAVVDSLPAKPVTPVPKAGNDGRLARPDTVAVVYPAPSKPLVPGSKTTPPPAPAPAPRTVSRLGTTVNKMPSYYEAYADARAEMDEALTYVDFRRVFAQYRFASPDSIRATRRMVSAAGNILRVYRGREVMLEQTYRPGEPEGKGSLREAFEVAEASRGLLADVDSLFAILVSQEGEVKYRDNALSFRNSRAAQAYSTMRRRVLQTLSYLGDPAESADRVTMPRLLRGFGTDRPPPAR